MTKAEVNLLRYCFEQLAKQCRNAEKRCASCDILEIENAEGYRDGCYDMYNLFCKIIYGRDIRP